MRNESANGRMRNESGYEPMRNPGAPFVLAAIVLSVLVLALAFIWPTG